MHSGKDSSAMDLERAAGESGLDAPSLLIEPLDGSPGWSFEADRFLYPASMIKVPLVAAALILLDEGGLDEGTPVEIDVANMTANDGPSPLVPGYRASLDELLFLTIAKSDNVGTNQLFDLLGRRHATRVVFDRLGLRETAFRRKLSGSDPLIDDPGHTGRNTHPARDAAALMGAIARDAFPGAGRLRSYLERQTWNTKLNAGLRPGDRFAHKTGDTSEVSHDGGILTTAGGARYVVIAYSGSGSTPEVDARFGTLMRAIRSNLAP